MNDFIQPVSDLIILHLKGEPLTAEEKKRLDTWLEADPQNKVLFNRLCDPAYMRQELEKMTSYSADSGWEKVKEHFTAEESAVVKPMVFYKRFWMAAAVAVVLIISAALLYMYLPAKKTAIAQTHDAKPATDIPAPSVSKATITLQNGKRISVDSLTTNAVDLQEKAAIQKTANGEIVYKAPVSSGSEIYFNTLTNPRGSKVVQVTLSDGTKVWLNTDSEIKYPVAFAAGSRQIEMVGEAYFEVAKDAARPFIVKSGKTVIQVTGTHFNVNAYPDEKSLNVSLLEGRVNVVKDNKSIPLAPGEQAQVSEEIKVDSKVDMDQVMAWKNGTFNFNGEDIYTAMRQLSRWYNVTIQFKENVTEKFYGDIPRDNNISSVLSMLETTGRVHFKTTGNSIEVFK